MNDHYVYQGPPEERSFGPLPEGDYAFKIMQADPPYHKNDKWIMSLKIAIEPGGLYVFSNPWSGVDRNGEMRDGIAELLHCVNYIPPKGKEPQWHKLIGLQGKCRLKVETATMGAMAGKQVNRVAYFHSPKPLANSPTEQQQSYSREEVEQSRTEQRRKSGDEEEEQDIPF